MRKKIIFNADDFGLTKGVNLGIIETFKNGPVRSTTIMAGADEYNHAVRLARENPDLKVGIHLVLSGLNSVGGSYETLTDPKGRLLSLVAIEQCAIDGTLHLEEVEREFEAQIEKVLKSGIVPSHIDSHHHVHRLPGVANVTMKVAKKYGIDKIRMGDKGLPKDKTFGFRTTDYFEMGFFKDGVSIENLKRLIENNRGNSIEVMVHPAVIDDELVKISTYNKTRKMETDILTSKELKEFLEQGNYDIIDFTTL